MITKILKLCFNITLILLGVAGVLLKESYPITEAILLYLIFENGDLK